MRHVEEFNKFLTGEVNLTRSQRSRLNRRVRAVYEYLSQTLDDYVKHERQGSYALDTIIQPVSGTEYDADILVFMENRRGRKARSYMDEVHKALRGHKSYADKLQRKTRAIVLNYAGDFHLDVVPCIEQGNHAQICNYEENILEPTDGTGYREWLNGKTEVTNGHLKGVTKLLKYVRDHKGNFEVPSILLTTLIGQSVHYNERGKRFKDLPETLKVVSNRVNSFLQATPYMPRLRNPSLRSERFRGPWNQSQYMNLREKFRVYNERINAAYEEPNPRRSIDMWRVMFGDGFG